MKKTFKWSGLTAAMTKMLACLTISAMIFTSCEDAIEETVSKSAESISLDQTELALTLGDTSTSLKAIFNPIESFNQLVTWSSSDPTRVTVSGTGVLSALKVTDGVTITATSKDGGHTATCEVSVVPSSFYIPVEGMSLDVSTLEIMQGLEYDFVLDFDPTPTNQDVFWSVKDASPEGCITVVDGHLVAAEIGTATVVATSDEDSTITAECDVEVIEYRYVPVESVTVFDAKGAEVDPTATIKLMSGQTMQFSATFAPADATYPDIIWSIEDATIADGITVSETGLMTAVTALTEANLVATVDNFSTKIPVKVVSDYSVEADGSWTIFTVDGLASFRDAVNGGESSLCATLANPMDLGEIEDWTPIGTTAAPYAGTFDGAAMDISNMLVNDQASKTSVTEDDNRVGFFGSTNGATIKNVYMSNGTAKGAQFIGNLIGYAENTTIIGCALGTTWAQGFYNTAGSIAGHAQDCTIIGTSTKGKALCNGWACAGAGFDSTTSDKSTGSFCGTMSGTTVIGSYSVGGSATGGAYGAGFSAKINGCTMFGMYSMGASQRTDTGIAWTNAGSHYTDCYWASGSYTTECGQVNKSTSQNRGNEIAGVTTVEYTAINDQAVVDALNAAIDASGNAEAAKYKYVLGDTYPVLVLAE